MPPYTKTIKNRVVTDDLVIFRPQMEQQPYKRRHKSGMPDFRSLLDYFMGALMIFGGLFIAFSEKMLGYDYFEGSSLVQGGWKWFLGGIFGVYGIFRLYRGRQIQLMRQRDRDFE